MAQAVEDRFLPIIYVRGYAMSQSEIDATTADPFCGFNIGSTVYRAVPDKKLPPRKYIFESPVVRLASEFQYRDVYENGLDILDPGWEIDAQGNPTGNTLTRRCIVVCRYYDEASQLLGTDKPPKIEDFAKTLGALILRVRDLVVKGDSTVKKSTFKCYLVAHSMGGLVCRVLLQNPSNEEMRSARDCVDKFFTYATPHNGIDAAGVNVPEWLGKNGMNTFNREKMASYLGIEATSKKHDGRVDLVPEAGFPSDRIFCMVGTNRLDYEAALGLSRTFVGHGSDGLVRIENATLTGVKANGQISGYCAKAFCYRAHSGFFGIVNSEEAYQNLTRFLFGDVRVDIWIDFTDVRLPKAVQDQEDSGRRVDALYQIEILASPRGKLWYLTRRTVEEDSVACFTQEQWRKAKTSCTQFVSTIFLANRAKVSTVDRTLTYSMQLGIRVPDYEIERKLWVNEHYEGSYLFRDTVLVQLLPPEKPGGEWHVKYDWQGRSVNPPTTPLTPDALAKGKVEIELPFDSRGTEGAPGITGTVRFVVSAWNV